MPAFTFAGSSAAFDSKPRTAASHPHSMAIRSSGSG
jgi:hypothetical protein